MSIYSKILVVADINHDEQPALARAMQLAQKSTSVSHITFFLSIYDFSYDMTSMLSLEERDAHAQGGDPSTRTVDALHCRALSR